MTIPKELKAQLKQHKKSGSLRDHILGLKGEFDVDHILLTYYQKKGLIARRSSVEHAIFIMFTVKGELKRVSRGKYQVIGDK